MTEPDFNQRLKSAAAVFGAVTEAILDLVWSALDALILLIGVWKVESIRHMK